ncbi:hypothetical protein GCM10023088_66360 [Actinomadura verrucosospora]
MRNGRDLFMESVEIGHRLPDQKEVVLPGASSGAKIGSCPFGCVRRFLKPEPELVERVGHLLKIVPCAGVVLGGGRGGRVRDQGGFAFVVVRIKPSHLLQIDEADRSFRKGVVPFTQGPPC